MRILLSITAPNPIKTPLLFLLRSSSSLPSSSFSLGMSSRPRRLAAHKGFAWRLWTKCSTEATFAKYAPFTVCLASGNLNIDQFRQYIYLHSCILEAFAQAYKEVEACLEADATQALRSYELNSFLEEWDVDPSIYEGRPININLSFGTLRRFLHAIVRNEVKGLNDGVFGFDLRRTAAFVVGAMTTHARLYAFIGKEIKAHSKDNHHPYQRWIDCYSSHTFEASVKQSERLLESLSVSLKREELDIVEKIYYQAMNIEVELFRDQLTVRTVVPLTKCPYGDGAGAGPGYGTVVIFSDFNLTCSVDDTAKLLRRLTIRGAPKSDPSEDGSTRMSEAELRNAWRDHERQCLQEYQQCIKSVLPSNKVVFNYEVLSQALEQVSDYKRRAHNREYGLLKDLKLEDIKRAGESMRLQEGCTIFFREIASSNLLNATARVLSYSCADLIRSALSSKGLDYVDVRANMLAAYNDTGRSSHVKIHLDKIEASNKILEEINGSKKLTVWIGRGIHCDDLLYLLQADIGIVIGSGSRLRRVGTRFGVAFRPLYPELLKIQKQYVEGSSPEWKTKSGVLYTVSNWAEIYGLVVGIETVSSSLLWPVSR